MHIWCLYNSCDNCLKHQREPMGQFITVEPIALAFQHSYCKNKRVQLFSASQCIHCVPKNETRIILNTLYSRKSIAMKFSTWYPKIYVVFLSKELIWHVSSSEKSRLCGCITIGVWRDVPLPLCMHAAMYATSQLALSMKPKNIVPSVMLQLVNVHSVSVFV